MHSGNEKKQTDKKAKATYNTVLAFGFKMN